MVGNFNSELFNINLGNPLCGFGLSDVSGLYSFPNAMYSSSQVDFFRSIESCFLKPSIDFNVGFINAFNPRTFNVELFAQGMQKIRDNDISKPIVFSTNITMNYLPTEVSRSKYAATKGVSSEAGTSNNSIKTKNGAPYQPNINTSEYNTCNDIILKYAKEYDVDPNFVKAVIKQESRFKANAGSRAGAKGLMQLMPATARSYGVTNVYDPEQNVKAGVKMLSELIKRYNGNLEDVLAAYNWGIGNLRLEAQGKKVRPKETRQYVPAVLGFYREYSRA